MMTINQALKEATKKLSKISSTPQLDAEVLLSFLLKKSREYILTYPERKINIKQMTKFNHFIKRRLNYEPIAYLIGQKEFYGLNFKVTKDTLIPRPETEHLVDAVLSNSQLVNGKKIIITDIGTGSGNIIVSLAKKIENENLLHASSFMLYGIDISQKTLTVAKQNAKKNNVADKIKFLQGNLLQPLIEKLPAGRQGWKLKIEKLIITANLPYLSKKIYSTTMPDVKNFEPKSALLSGMDGLDHYEKLFQQIALLKKNCFMFHACLPKRQFSCFIEISPEQKNKLKKLILGYFPDAKIEFKKDLAKKWRIVVIEI